MSVTHPIENKDFRAVALTCIVMKCFKKIIFEYDQTKDIFKSRPASVCKQGGVQC